MAPLTNRVKVYKDFWGLFIAAKNFAFEVKAILGMESTHLESQDERKHRWKERKKRELEVAHHLNIFTKVSKTV